ncbi:MAG: ATP phosphoribosyltransferase regulatory subunit, partial [Chitinispirillales bacterium]|nr:ATP phosphoribosyltransferase regulatory subunit [Chitinispirillales bacterium]
NGDAKSPHDAATSGQAASTSTSTQINPLGQLKKLFSLIGAYGLSDYVLFDIGIVRGLAYYTGIVFELVDVNGNLRAIAGGGRYDNLVQLYGGPKTPAVGFAAGDVVLGELLKQKSLTQAMPPRSDVFIVSIDSDGYGYGEAIKAARRLRSSNISCEFPLKEGAKISRQLELANAARAKYALFIGGDEAKSGRAKLKNLLSGDEELVGIDDLVANIKIKIF